VEEKKVLIVDDEKVILNMLRDTLTLEGYTVRTAENADEAWNILRQESIMCMFIDLNLPGTSGLQLGEDIRKQNQVAIIYAFTGNANFFGLMDCRVAGFDDFFLKPVPIEIFLKAVADAFEKIERWKVAEFDLL
jgi:DNA-binding NtrC family response regulator